VIPLLYRPLKQPAYRAKGLWPVQTKRNLVRSIYLSERRGPCKWRKRPMRASMFDLRYVKGWPVCG